MKETSAPRPKQEVVQFNEFGMIRTDPYHWLNQRDNPRVLTYLKAENEYTESKMAPTIALQKKLYDEFKNRIKENDISVPYKYKNYFYYSRSEENKAYPIYCRKKNNLESKEEIILDVNKLAEGSPYFNVENWEISPNEQLLAYAVDTQGRRKYQIKIIDLKTGQHLQEDLHNLASDFEWANDSKTLFYVKQHPVTLRYYQVFRHKLGQSMGDDSLVYEEKDDTFYVAIEKSKSDQYLMIGVASKDTTEYSILNADTPEGNFVVFTPRKKGHEYYIDHHEDQFLIRTNENALNFKMMRCPKDKTNIQHWVALLPYVSQNYIETFQVFKDFYVVGERRKGIPYLKVYPFKSEKPFEIQFEEPDYTISLTKNPDYNAKELRFEYSSLKTPDSIYDFNVEHKQKILKKKKEILGGFDASHYHADIIYAKAKDNVEIPISLIYRKDKFKQHTNPLYIAGYGAYGVIYDPEFNPFLISLLDRGFVFAIAHVRGGSELGRNWYFDGKFLKKKNTFNDFIAVAEHLRDKGYGAKDKIYATGGSAGGLLIGAVINIRPDLFKGVIANVPFVDLINTMLDPDIPLTTAEYDEWGNPHEKEYYEYMLSYSPYDNVRAQKYPHVLAISAYHDSQVQYWEPAKWIARLRDYNQSQNLILLQTMMEASHSGASGRYGYYQQKAFEYAFLLHLEGMSDSTKLGTND